MIALLTTLLLALGEPEAAPAAAPATEAQSPEAPKGAAAPAPKVTTPPVARAVPPPPKAKAGLAGGPPNPCEGPGGETRPNCEGRAPTTRDAISKTPPPGPATPKPGAGPADDATPAAPAAPAAPGPGTAPPVTAKRAEAGPPVVAEKSPRCSPAQKCAPPPGVLARYGLPLAGVVVALLLLLAAAVVLSRRRGRTPAAPAVRSEPPTALRRDLVLVDGKNGQHRLPGARLNPSATIGSGNKVTLLLASPGVADIHAELWVRDGRLWLRPAGAETVVLNDRLLTARAAEIISTGDRIRLGTAEYWIMID